MLPEQSSTKSCAFILLKAIEVTILFKSYFRNEVKTELSGKDCKISAQAGTRDAPALAPLAVTDQI